MKNLKLIYEGIKNVEDKTLFKFEYVDDDNELHFKYFKEDFELILSSARIYLDPEECVIIFTYEEICVLMQLMQILKEI